MLNRTCAPSLSLFATLILLGACASNGGGAEGGAGNGHPTGGDVDGKIALPGVVRIAKVAHAPDGKVTYYLENISGKVQEDLTYWIDFSYPAVGNGAIEIREDHRVTPERDLVLLKSDLDKPVTESNPEPGKKVESTKITVQDSPPVAVVARDASGSGTPLLNGALECVGLSPEEDRFGDSPTLWIEVENVSGKAISGLEAKAVFVGSADKKQSKWTGVKDLKPGARARVEFNLAGLGRLSTYTFFVKIRQQSL